MRYQFNLLKAVLLAVFCMLILGSCVEKNRYSAEIRIPVIKECKSDLMKTVNSDMFKELVGYEYKDFNYAFASEQFPNLIGYIIIKLKNQNRENPKKYLESIVNGPILDCYPVTTSSINNEKLGAGLKSKIHFIKKLGSKEQYLTISDDGITIYFSKPE